MVKMTYRIHIGMFPQQLVEPVASLVVPAVVSRGIKDNSDLGQFGPWSIRTSAVDNSDLGQFGPWSIRTSTTGQFGPHKSEVRIDQCFFKSRVRIDQGPN